MPHLTTPNPTSTTTAPVIAVLTGRTGSGQTTMQILSCGVAVSTTTYPDGAWVAVHGPGHPGAAVLVDQALPKGLRMPGYVQVDGRPLLSEDSVDRPWTVRACTKGKLAIVTRTPSADSAVLRVQLTVPAAQAREEDHCSHDPRCPESCASDAPAATAVASHPEQGWSLLCNGTLLFEDSGAVLPDGRILEPARTTSQERST